MQMQKSQAQVSAKQCQQTPVSLGAPVKPMNLASATATAPVLASAQVGATAFGQGDCAKKGAPPKHPCPSLHTAGFQGPCCISQT